MWFQCLSLWILKETQMSKYMNMSKVVDYLLNSVKMILFLEMKIHMLYCRISSEAGWINREP